MNDGRFAQQTTGWPVVTLLPRICFSDLELLGDTLSQSLHISPKPMSSNPTDGFYSSLESAIISGKHHLVSDVSKFHPQLVLMCILHLIIPGERTQNELNNDSFKLSAVSPVPLVFSQAFIFLNMEYYFKLCQGVIRFLIWDVVLFPLIESKRLV